MNIIQIKAFAHSNRYERGTPVSTTLDWDRAKADLNPFRFNLRTITERLDGAKARWADRWGYRQDLARDAATG